MMRVLLWKRGRGLHLLYLHYIVVVFLLFDWPSASLRFLSGIAYSEQFL